MKEKSHSCFCSSKQMQEQKSETSHPGLKMVNVAELKGHKLFIKLSRKWLYLTKKIPTINLTEKILPTILQFLNVAGHITCSLACSVSPWAYSMCPCVCDSWCVTMQIFAVSFQNWRNVFGLQLSELRRWRVR